jgi:hypothetical protein
MEQITNTNSIEMYTLDIEELNNLIKQTTRANLKRQFEQYKLNLESLLAEEKRKIENIQKKQIQVDSSSTAANNTLTNTTNFVTVSKYALDSGDKFVK